MKRPNIAIVGAEGILGREILNILQQRNFSYSGLRLLSNSPSFSRKIVFNNANYTIDTVTAHSFKGIDLSFFLGDENTSYEFVPEAVEVGCQVIDRSGIFVSDNSVPQIVPEVNAHTLKKSKGIIACPGCAAIFLSLILRPIQSRAGLKKIFVSTYQSVSESSQEAEAELKRQIKSILEEEPYKAYFYPHPIAFNLIPQVEKFESEGKTKEEINLAKEFNLIMNDLNIFISSTCVRVPVLRGSALSVSVETRTEINEEQAKYIFSKTPGVVLFDEPENHIYPMPLNVIGRDEVFVGRVRGYKELNNLLNLWIVGDNLRKGSVLNMVQIAEIMLRENLI